LEITQKRAIFSKNLKNGKTFPPTEKKKSGKCISKIEVVYVPLYVRLFLPLF
jgi:hypothetical protein